MTKQSDQTMSLTDLLALSEDARLGRAAEALEKIAAAAPRIADAVEVLAGLLASCVGVGSARCYGENERAGHEVPLNYLRSGDGSKPFACDADKSGDDDGQ
ncbi:hypothetical protein ABIB00_007356 [Bradyrhizobium sp. LB14.3]|uniref:hypothetical protein n=1 Tax=Bradyrhizobium sp. LB14.3 TaxID=3156328 RepID=UPI0033921848